jgi:hypothetical protein
MKIEASKRLATSVSAATNTKGAVKFLKGAFKSAGLTVKSAEANGDNIVFVLKGPNGDVVVSASLFKDGSVSFGITDATGLLPRAINAEIYNPEIVLKRGKGGARDLNPTIKAMGKGVKEAQEFAQNAEECRAWLVAFQEALRSIEQQMDKKKRGA